MLAHTGIKVIDVDSGDEVFSSSKLRFFAFSSDGKTMVAAGRGKNFPVDILSTDSWKTVFSRKKTAGNRTAIATSKDSKVALIGLADCRIEACDLDRITK